MTQSVSEPQVGPVHRALLEEALQAAGVSDVDHFNGTLMLTTTCETVFSAGENPFRLINFRTTEVINSILTSFQDRNPNIINDLFNESSTFSELAQRLCVVFDLTEWSASIGDFTVTTNLRITVELS